MSFIKEHSFPIGLYLWACRFLAKNLAFWDPPSLKFHNPTDINPDKPNPYDDFAQHEGNFSCTKCSETFNNLQTLTYHFNDHNKIENLWQCPLCPKNSKLLKNLWKHERISHLNIRPKPIKHEEGVEVFHCAVCDFSSTKKALLVRYGSTQFKIFFKVLSKQTKLGLKGLGA